MSRSALVVILPLALAACATPPPPPVVAGSPLSYSRPAGRGLAPAAIARDTTGGRGAQAPQGATAVVDAPTANRAGETPVTGDATPTYVEPPIEVEVPSYQLPANRPLR